MNMNAMAVSSDREFGGVAAEKEAAEAFETATAVFDQAWDDLRGGEAGDRADALFWFACPNSELYKDIAPRYGIEMVPADFAERIFEFTGIRLPKGGITSLAIDTEDRSDWCFMQDGEAEQTFYHRIRLNTDQLANLVYAEVNGVRVMIRGKGARAVRFAMSRLGMRGRPMDLPEAPLNVAR